MLIRVVRRNWCRGMSFSNRCVRANWGSRMAHVLLRLVTKQYQMVVVSIKDSKKKKSTNVRGTRKPPPPLPSLPELNTRLLSFVFLAYLHRHCEWSVVQEGDDTFLWRFRHRSPQIGWILKKPNDIANHDPAACYALWFTISYYADKWKTHS